MDKNFLGRLLELRGNMTEVDFAKKIGWNLMTLRGYFIRGSKPPYDFIIKVCEAFNVSATWLLWGIGPKWASKQLLELKEPEEQYCLIEDPKLAKMKLQVEKIYKKGGKKQAILEGLLDELAPLTEKEEKKIAEGA
jgi:transcriptional regulator with XRE-family HTH domain